MRVRFRRILLYRGIVARGDSREQSARDSAAWSGRVGDRLMTSFPIVSTDLRENVRLGKPPIMAITLFLDRDRAKTCDSPRPAGEKLLRKSPFMAISFSWTTITPKTATNHHRLGKSLRENANHGDHALIGPRSRQSQRQLAAGLGKTQAETANHGDHAFSGSPSCQSWRPVGKIPAEAVNHGEFEEAIYDKGSLPSGFADPRDRGLPRGFARSRLSRCQRSAVGS